MMLSMLPNRTMMTEQLQTLQKAQRRWRFSLSPLWAVKVWNVTIVRSKFRRRGSLVCREFFASGEAMDGKCPQAAAISPLAVSHARRTSHDASQRHRGWADSLRDKIVQSVSSESWRCRWFGSMKSSCQGDSSVVGVLGCLLSAFEVSHASRMATGMLETRDG